MLMGPNRLNSGLETPFRNRRCDRGRSANCFEVAAQECARSRKTDFVSSHLAQVCSRSQRKCVRGRSAKRRDTRLGIPVPHRRSPQSATRPGRLGYRRGSAREPSSSPQSFVAAPLPTTPTLANCHLTFIFISPSLHSLRISPSLSTGRSRPRASWPTNIHHWC